MPDDTVSQPAAEAMGEPPALEAGSAAAPIAPVAIDYGRPDDASRRWGTGFLPAAASFYLPGLGQLIAGHPRRAAAWFLAWLAILVALAVVMSSPALIVALAVLLPLLVVFALAGVVDAFRRGRASARRMLPNAALRYLAGLALLAAPMLFNPTDPLSAHIRARHAEAFRMPTTGMAPTLQPGDCVFAHKSVGEVRRWDIIVFDLPAHPRSRFVQRVAGMPGETVIIVDGQLHIDGSPVPPPPGVPGYANAARGGNATASRPLMLGPDEYFTLGDNAAQSFDGRYWEIGAPGHQPGAVPRDQIIGKVTTIYWPPSRWRRF